MRNVFICKPVEYDKSDCILQMISCMPSTWWINFCLLAPLWHTPLSQLLFRSVVGPSNLYEMVTYLYRYIKCIHAIYIYIYHVFFILDIFLYSPIDHLILLCQAGFSHGHPQGILRSAAQYILKQSWAPNTAPNETATKKDGYTPWN